MIEKEHPEKIFTPTSDRTIIYSNNTIHHATGWSDYWNFFFSGAGCKEYRI